MSKVVYFTACSLDGFIAEEATRSTGCSRHHTATTRRRGTISSQRMRVTAVRRGAQPIRVVLDLDRKR
jgi:hypothetical protein